MHFQAIYVSCTAGAESACLNAARGVVSEWRSSYSLRYRLGTGWVQVAPDEHAEVAHPKQGVAAAREILSLVMRGELPEEPSLSDRARELSGRLSATAVAIDVQPGVDHFMYARWKCGEHIRTLTRSSQHPDADELGWVQRSGVPEDWELDLFDQGAELTPEDVGRFLRLPGFGRLADSGPWSAEAHIPERTSSANGE